MEYHFVHYDDVEPFLFIPMKVEHDKIIDLSKSFKEEIQLILDLNNNPK